MSDIQVVIDPASADTSYAGSQANILAHSLAQIKFDNDQALFKYHAAYVDYVANMTSGGFVPPERRVPPPVPLGEVLGAPDSDGYQWPVPGTEPLENPLPTPTYNGGLPPVNKEPNVMLIGKRDGGPNSKWFGALPGDTFPNGQQTPPSATSEDGVTGVFTKFGGVASAGWYLLS